MTRSVADKPAPATDLTRRREHLEQFRTEIKQRFRDSGHASACIRAISSRIDKELRALWVQTVATKVPAESSDGAPSA